MIQTIGSGNLSTIFRNTLLELLPENEVTSIFRAWRNFGLDLKKKLDDAKANGKPGKTRV